MTGGLASNGTIIVNTAASPAEMRERLGIRAATVGVLDGLQIPVEESTGAATVILAMGAGRRAATAIDEYIRTNAAAMEVST